MEGALAMKRDKGLRIILVSFAIALMGCVCSATQVPRSQNARKRFVESIEEKTVALTEVDKRGNITPYCSGVWVSENKIVTAAHCTEDRDIIIYITKKDLNKGDLQLRLSAKLKSDESSDLAILLTDPGSTPKHKSARIISNSDVWSGKKLYIVGHTAGMWWTYTEGVISSSIRSMYDEGRTPSIQVSAPIWLGNSGGGAFDENGDLVGICSWISVKGPNLAFFMPPEAIVKILGK